MTAQARELFEYQDVTYPILGMQGGRFIPRSKVIIEILFTLDTGLYRGYLGTYAIDTSRQLVLKSVRYSDFLDDDFITQEKQINQFAPMTGHILFGDYRGRLEQLIGHGGDIKNPDGLKMFEAEILEGRVLNVKSCTAEILRRCSALSSDAQPHHTEGGDYKHFIQAYWDWTTLFLPRRYDILYSGTNYWDFPSLKGI